MTSLSDLEKIGIERLRAFVPPDGIPYFVAYSGGKDSDCIRILCELANVPYELHHSVTSMDNPYTMQYVKSISGVTFDFPLFSDGSRKSMWNLVPRKLIPPTRLMRYCCTELKEFSGRGRTIVTGVRKAESFARSQKADFVRVTSRVKSAQKRFDELGIDYRVSDSGGILLSWDNSSVRDNGDLIHHCFKNHTVSINPIIDWSDDDVWSFLRYYKCKSNPCYYMGFSRVGCVGCPLGGSKSMQSEFAKFPIYRKNIISAFDRMLANREKLGKPNRCNWHSGYDVFLWWVQSDILPGQLSFFDDDEIYNSFVSD